MIGLLKIRKTKLVLREITNYFFILKTIDKYSKGKEWKDYNLRTDMIGRIYTVISLREEDMGDMEEVKNFRVIERLRPLNEFLTKLGLQEVLVPNISEIPNSRSYLVTYTPLFNQFSWTWLAFNVILPIALILQFAI
jgi:hypothetical protein